MGHTIRFHADQLVVDGVNAGVHFTNMEQRFLRTVYAAKGVASKDFILNALYLGHDEPSSNRIIDVYACKVRRKLGAHGAALSTVWGRGYVRSEDYTVIDDEEGFTVSLPSSLIEDVTYVTGEEAAPLITRLLEAERDRKWAAAA